MLVMKFGGTSVGDALAMLRVVKNIAARSKEKLIVVVSAIADATNILEAAAQLAAAQKLDQANLLIDSLKVRHDNIVNDLFRDENLRLSAHQALEAFFKELRLHLERVDLLAELTCQSAAKIVSFGELLSSSILHLAMLQAGLKTALIDARGIIITNDDYLQGKPNLIKMQQVMPKLLNKPLALGDIILTQGFIASSEGGITTILGREGSDYTAALIGNVMQAKEVIIWTDVDGIMTCDPRRIKTAKLIPMLSFAEAEALSCAGAKVLHPLTMQPVAEKNIPLRIANSLYPQHKSTILANDSKCKARGVKAIAFKEHGTILQLTVKAADYLPKILPKILTVLDKHQAEFCFLASDETNLVLFFAKMPPTKAIEALALLTKINVVCDQALISLVGKELFEEKKLIARTLEAVLPIKVNYIMAGVSSLRFSFVVAHKDLTLSIKKIHTEFFGA